MLFYTFPSFDQTNMVTHGFTTRLGGVSEGAYKSLNLGLHVGDKVEDVLANRRLVAEAMGFKAEDFVAAQQVHGERIQVVQEVDRGRGSQEFEDALAETDALITAVPGIPLLTNYADCVPVFILDPVNRVVALAHGGWKSTLALIGRKTVLKMQDVYGSRPEDCLAGIGPSIGPCCFEVDDRVAGQFREVFFPYWPDLVKSVGAGKWNLDLWEANRRQLIDIGVPAAKIAVAGLCTNCQPQTFFSYRAEQGETGRMAAIIMLRKGGEYGKDLGRRR